MEEMKILIEALNNLGEGAKQAFIIWLLVKYALYYLIVAGVFYGVLTVLYKILHPLVCNLSFVSQIKSTMGYYSAYILSDEKNEVLNVLREYKKKA